MRPHRLVTNINDVHDLATAENVDIDQIYSGLSLLPEPLTHVKDDVARLAERSGMATSNE